MSRKLKKTPYQKFESAMAKLDYQQELEKRLMKGQSLKPKKKTDSEGEENANVR